MPPNFWSAFELQKYDILDELDGEICDHLFSHELYEVFRKRVKRAMKDHKIEVQNIVRDTKTGILSIPSPDLRSERHLDSFQKQIDYLDKALGRLRKLKVQSSWYSLRISNQGVDEQEEERIAAMSDKQAFEKALQEFRDSRKEKKMQFIEIHNNLDVPTTDLHVTTGRFKTCQQLLWYLAEAQVVAAPQLWIKCNDRQEITMGGAVWEHCKARQEIKSEEIYVVSAPKERGDYIVALVHEGTRENPVTLDLPKCGQPGEDSLYLQGYLRNAWPRHLVEEAARFSQPSDDSVLATRFDDSTFDARTNDLYVKCTKRP